MDILYQDRRIAVVNKPVGVLASDVPALLRQQLGTDCFRTVHRLDAQVGGLMVLARSVKAAEILSAQIRQRRFAKEYLTVTEGLPPTEGTLRDLLGRDTIRRVTYVTESPGKDVREAKLSYRVLETCEGISLVRIALQTGRTHQIRVQFASRGWPLWGDAKYGTARKEGSIALFSCHLGFAHPQTGEALSFDLTPQGVPWDAFSLCK